MFFCIFLLFPKTNLIFFRTGSKWRWKAHDIIFYSGEFIVIVPVIYLSRFALFSAQNDKAKRLSISPLELFGVVLFMAADITKILRNFVARDSINLHRISKVSISFRRTNDVSARIAADVSNRSGWLSESWVLDFGQKVIISNRFRLQHQASLLMNVPRCFLTCRCQVTYW